MHDILRQSEVKGASIRSQAIGPSSRQTGGVNDAFPSGMRLPALASETSAPASGHIMSRKLLAALSQDLSRAVMEEKRVYWRETADWQRELLSKLHGRLFRGYSPPKSAFAGEGRFLIASRVKEELGRHFGAQLKTGEVALPRFLQKLGEA